MNYPLDEAPIALQTDQMKDQDLIAMILNSNGPAEKRRAENILFKRYHYPLLAYFKVRAGVQGAKDLAQEVMLVTMCQLERFRGDSPFRYYVFAVARRILSEYFRRGKRQPKGIGVNSGDLSDQRIDPCISPDAMVFYHEFYESLPKVIDALVAEDRRVLSLRLQGYDDPQIAEALGIKRNTVRSQLSRERFILRKRLWPFFSQTGVGWDSK